MRVRLYPSFTRVQIASIPYPFAYNSLYIQCVHHNIKSGRLNHSIHDKDLAFYHQTWLLHTQHLAPSSSLGLANHPRATSSPTQTSSMSILAKSWRTRQLPFTRARSSRYLRNRLRMTSPTTLSWTVVANIFALDYLTPTSICAPHLVSPTFPAPLGIPAMFHC